MGGTTRGGLLALLAGIAMAAQGAPALAAAPPPNDDFDAATVISSLPFSDGIDTSQATTAADDPYCAGNGASVWYRFTPTQDVDVQADTFGSSYDTTLSAFTGSRGSLTPVACNDDSGSLQSKISFTALAGTTYYIMAAAYGSGSGGQLSISTKPVAPPGPECDGEEATIIGTPGNDRLNGTAGRDVIVGLGGDDTINGLGGDDVICGGDGPDVVDGGDGNDWIDGEASSDDLSGGNGNDILQGGAGLDSLRGGNG